MDNTSPYVVTLLEETNAKRAELAAELRELEPTIRRIATEAAPLADLVWGLGDLADKRTEEEESRHQAAVARKDVVAILEIQRAQGQRQQDIYARADTNDFYGEVVRLKELLEMALDGEGDVHAEHMKLLEQKYGKDSEHAQITRWAFEQEIGGVE